MAKRNFFWMAVCLLATASSSCALLPRTVAIGVDESRTVRRAFEAMNTRLGQCRRSLDADVVVTYKSLLQSGTVSGYLQTMAPSYFKFVGVNPLGQPLIILATDGHHFRFVSVPESKAFDGDVGAKKFVEQAPAGFRPDFGFYWLTGRLWPASEEIVAIRKDKENQGYWLELCCGEEAVRSRLLFDPQESVVRRHIVHNDKKKVLMDVRYDDYQKDAATENGLCPLPGKITVTSRKHSGAMILLLSWAGDVGEFTRQDFDIDIPAFFERVSVH